MGPINVCITIGLVWPAEEKKNKGGKCLKEEKFGQCRRRTEKEKEENIMEKEKLLQMGGRTSEAL